MRVGGEGIWLGINVVWDFDGEFGYCVVEVLS